MGLTRYFYTDQENPRPMTFEEVKAGVQAVKAVAERRKDEFRVDHLTNTAIVINVRSDNAVESFCFEPTKIDGGLFVQEFNYCKTNEYPEDEGVREMIGALQSAVNNKLHVSD